VMSNGNFILGVGLGYRETELLASGITREELVERFTESIALIKSVWDKEEDSNFTSKYFSLKDAKINPRPTSRPRPPILVGAYTDSAVKRAGEIGDGWIVPPELSGESLGRKVALYKNAMHERRGVKGTLAMMRAFHVTSDEEETNSIRALIGSHFSNKRKMGLPKKVGVSDAETIVGNSSDCVEMISEIRRRYDPDHLILLMGFRGITNDQVMESIRIAGKSVLAHFES
jgi:alkanesulfonate monooxygenase SsuD/methylene tetrahydromethanopterin reductase-like flavin-dependent oxidoreductase (luciferase family)